MQNLLSTFCYLSCSINRPSLTFYPHVKILRLTWEKNFFVPGNGGRGGVRGGASFLYGPDLKRNFYLTLLLRKVMLDLATNLHKISSKLTIKTPEPHQLTSLQCLYCKLYTHFTTSLVFIPLPLNMKLFAGQLSSFWEDM